MTTPEDIIQKLNPETQKLVDLASSIKVEKNPVASVGLTQALNGGINRGSFTLVWGSKSAGKSSFLLETIALRQKQGLVCAWIDAEKCYDPQWAERLGVDSDKLIISRVNSIEDMADTSVALVRAGVDMLVVDSISALLPSSFYNKEGDEMKGHQDTKQIGTFSKDLTTALKMINAANTNTEIHLVSQMSNAIGVLVTLPQPQGGFGIKFYSSVIIKLWANASETKQIKGSVQIGNQVVERPIGREVNWTIEYSKTSEPAATGKYTFLYNKHSYLFLSGTDNYL